MPVIIRGDARLKRSLTKLARLGTNKKEVHTTMAVTVEKWILENFKKEGGKLKGRPWKKLSDVTIARRRKGKRAGRDKILQDTGIMRRSVNREVTQRSARVGLSVDYAPIHNFGKGNIPQRRILPEESEVIDDIVRQVNLLIEKKIRRLF